MKNAKIFLTSLMLVLFTSLFCVQSNAQTFTLKGGLNLANTGERTDGTTFWFNDIYKINPGFHVGATVDVPIFYLFSIETGLFLTTKGMAYEPEVEEAILSWENVDISAKTNLYYVDIPLTLKATYPLNDNLKVFCAAGPYVGIGVSGKTKVTVEYQGVSVTDEEDIKWWGDKSGTHLRRFDPGLTFGGGVEINAVQLGISYDYGLLNISPDDDNRAMGKNRVLRLSVGYRFGK